MEQPPAPPTAPSYPGFAMTDDGLARLHQLVGKLLHESIEKDIRLARSSPPEQGADLLKRIMERIPRPPEAGDAPTEGAA